MLSCIDRGENTTHKVKWMHNNKEVQSNNKSILHYQLNWGKCSQVSKHCCALCFVCTARPPGPYIPTFQRWIWLTFNFPHILKKFKYDWPFNRWMLLYVSFQYQTQARDISSAPRLRWQYAGLIKECPICLSYHKLERLRLMQLDSFIFPGSARLFANGQA